MPHPPAPSPPCGEGEQENALRKGEVEKHYVVNVE